MKYFVLSSQSLLKVSMVQYYTIYTPIKSKKIRGFAPRSRKGKDYRPILKTFPLPCLAFLARQNFLNLPLPSHPPHFASKARLHMQRLTSKSEEKEFEQWHKMFIKK